MRVNQLQKDSETPYETQMEDNDFIDIFRDNGRTGQVVPFPRVGLSKRKFVMHFH